MSNQKCRLCLKLNPIGSRFCNFCGNDLTFSIQPDGLLPPGAVLRGYVIENVIGEGGMGVVYGCHHRTLGTRHAMKVLDPKQARIDILRKRFLAEAKIQATVRHPHIVHVLDVIDSEKDGGIPGVLAIVMEYVEGVALSQKLENGPFSERDAVSSALVILDAIGFAHHSKIVHRDLKPSNIMISEADSKIELYRGIKVMDFGIAKLLQEQEQRTVTGSQMGTPGYMAPEQIENARNVDERTDIYAIGLTLYEMLCGRTPFQEYRDFELYNAQIFMRPPSIRNYRPDVSDRLETIVMKALEKDRANRYQNAESFQRALLSLGGYEEIPLRLNPYEGTSIVPTNDLLQKKIKRAIKAMNNEPATEDQPKPKSSGMAARKAAKRAAKDKARLSGEQEKASSLVSKEVEAIENNPKSTAELKVEKKGASITKTSVKATLDKQGKKTSGNAAEKCQASDAKSSGDSGHGMTRHSSESHLPRTSSHKSIVRLVEEKHAESDPCTQPTRTFKRQKSSTRLSRIGRSSQTQNQENKVETQTTDKKSTNAAVSETPKKTKSTTASPKSRQSLEPHAAETTSARKASKRNAQNASKAEITDSPKSSRTHLALKIVIVAIILLIVAGLFYRHHKSMPLPDAAVLLPTTPVESEVSVEPKTVQNTNTLLPVKEIHTDTGTMTHIPAASHWVRTTTQNELSQIELDAFDIDQVEVSYFQYLKCIEAQKCPPLSTIPGDLNLPVTGIGYGSAAAFCEFAGKKLPTAEQWEAAARFGGETNGITHVNVSCETIHFASRKECKKSHSAAPESVFLRVQSANPGHLLNMLGNVREWTSTPDSRDKQKHHTKGGSYLSERAEISIGATILSPVNSGESDLGFRCIK